MLSSTLLSLYFIALCITIYQYFSFIIIVVYIIVCCCYYFPLSSWLCVTGAWVGAGFAGGARGWVTGRAGFWNVLATWVPGHPTSMGDSGVNKRFFCFRRRWRTKQKMPGEFKGEKLAVNSVKLIIVYICICQFSVASYNTRIHVSCC